MLGIINRLLKKSPTSIPLAEREATGPFGLEKPPATEGVFKRFIAEDPVTFRRGRGVINPDGSADIQWGDAMRFKNHPVHTACANEAEWRRFFKSWPEERYRPEYGPAIEDDIRAGRISG